MKRTRDQGQALKRGRRIQAARSRDILDIGGLRDHGVPTALMHDVALVTASTADSRCTTVDSNAAETLMQIKISKFFDFWAGDISGSLNGIHSSGTAWHVIRSQSSSIRTYPFQATVVRCWPQFEHRPVAPELDIVVPVLDGTLFRDSSAISTGIAVLLSAVTTPGRASVQTGEPPNLAREGDPIGLTSEAGGFARPRPPFGRCPGLTTVVTGRRFR